MIQSNVRNRHVQPKIARLQWLPEPTNAIGDASCPGAEIARAIRVARFLKKIGSL